MIKELAICAEIEETVGQIYRMLAEQLPPDDELRVIWEEMADDEMDHARSLQFAQRLDAQKVYEGFSLDETQLGQLLVQVKETFDLVQIRPWSDDEAIGMMLALEEEFQQVHVRFAAKFKDPSMQKMFENLGKGDEQHVERLKSFHRSSV